MECRGPSPKDDLFASMTLLVRALWSLSHDRVEGDSGSIVPPEGPRSAPSSCDGVLIRRFAGASVNVGFGDP
jgi:hypothetical protein